MIMLHLRGRVSSCLNFKNVVIRFNQEKTSKNPEKNTQALNRKKIIDSNV